MPRLPTMRVIGSQFISTSPSVLGRTDFIGLVAVAIILLSKRTVGCPRRRMTLLISRTVGAKRLDDEASAGLTTYGNARAAFSFHQSVAVALLTNTSVADSRW